MRRMLLLACAVGVCGSVAVVAFAADAPIAERPSAPTPGGSEVPAPESGPFAVAAAQAQSEAAADRRRAVRRSYRVHDHGGYDRYGGRARLIVGIAEHLDVERRTMWRAVWDVRRRIAPRSWSDARDEALRLLARELDRPVAEVERAVRRALRDQLAAGNDYSYVYRGGR